MARGGMIDPLLEQLLPGFVDESQEIVQRLTQNLLELEKAHETKRFDDLARGLHTLKGSSATLGLDELSELAGAHARRGRAAARGGAVARSPAAHRGTAARAGPRRRRSFAARAFRADRRGPRPARGCATGDQR